MTLDDLRKIAEQATKGPWKVETDEIGTDFGDDIAYGIKSVAPVTFYSDSDMAHLALDPLTPEDAEFIATFNPARVLEMIDTLRGAEIRLDHAKTVIDRLQTRLAAVEQIADAIEEHDAPFEASPTAQWIRKAARGE